MQSQIRPVDERELARVLAEATNSRTPLAVAGAGSKRDVGRPVQAAAVTDSPATPDLHEVAVRLPRGQIAVGRLKVGERVDVFATADGRTDSVVRGATVVQLEADDDGSLTSDREVTLVVAVPSGDAVAAVVHALRTGDVTVVRSTLDVPTAEDPTAFSDGEASGDSG